MKELSFPFTEEKIRALQVGDEVAITGTVFTGRDASINIFTTAVGFPPA